MQIKEFFFLTTLILVDSDSWVCRSIQPALGSMARLVIILPYTLARQSLRSTLMDNGPSIYSNPFYYSYPPAFFSPYRPYPYGYGGHGFRHHHRR